MSVEAVCADGKSLKPLAKGCSIAHVPEDDGCQHGRRFVRLAIANVCESVFVPFVHHDCIHNQVASVHNRVAMEVPRPTADGLAALRVAGAKIAALLPETTPEDYYIMPMRYSGAKRTRYIQATDEVLDFGLEKMDSSVKMFVKCERVQPDDGKPNPDPRAIQFRNAKYCVELARFLKPIEEHLYALSGVGRGVPPTRVVAKGLNQPERADLLVEKLRSFSDPRIIELDASRFDGHVDVEQLKIEHSVYTHCCHDPYFALLLSWQLMNRVTSSRGMRYKVKGKRMSGDMNTALGNCILMIVMLVAFMVWCKKWDILDDGDDVLLIVESRDVPRILGTIKAHFLTYGHELKVEKVSDELVDVEFCQSKVIEFEVGKYKFVRNPWKVLSCALTGIKYYNQQGARPKLLYSIGLCELVLGLGVPVLQEFALAILRNCGVTKGLELPHDSAMMARVRRELRYLGLRTLERIDPRPVQECARESFARAFGMSRVEQVKVETSLKSWVFTLEGCIHIPPEWNVPLWERDPLDTSEMYPL